MLIDGFSERKTYQLTKNLPEIIYRVVKLYKDLLLLLDFSKGSFLHFGTRKLTAEFLLSVVFFRKRLIFWKDFKTYYLLLCRYPTNKAKIQQFFKLILLISIR